MLPLAGCSLRGEWSLHLQGGVSAEDGENGRGNAGHAKLFHGQPSRSACVEKFCMELWLYLRKSKDISSKIYPVLFTPTLRVTTQMQAILISHLGYAIDLLPSRLTLTSLSLTACERPACSPNLNLVPRLPLCSLPSWPFNCLAT